MDASEGSDNYWYHFDFFTLPYPFDFSLQVLISVDLLFHFVFHPGVKRARYITNLAYLLLFVIKHEIWPIMFKLVVCLYFEVPQDLVPFCFYHSFRFVMVSLISSLHSYSTTKLPVDDMSHFVMSPVLILFLG